MDAPRKTVLYDRHLAMGGRMVVAPKPLYRQGACRLDVSAQPAPHGRA
jgi:hypothetical protein